MLKISQQLKELISNPKKIVITKLRIKKGFVQVKVVCKPDTLHLQNTKVLTSSTKAKVSDK